MKHSSSSVSEEDVPLKQRVKTKAQTVVKKAKKEVRKNAMPAQAKSKKFVIPRNKNTRELLDIQGLESRDAIELLRKVKQSFYQPDNISNYVFENVVVVHNARFNTEFSAKKQEMRQDGYAQKDLEDTFAYLYLDNWHKVRKMAKEGLYVGSSHLSTLGDPKMGVYISRFPDVVLPRLIPVRSSKYLMVFKIAKGKLKAVGERTGNGCTLEPTPNYDGHISKSFPFAHNVSLEQAFTSSQYYFYEFADDGDDLHAKRPRQCCPYAVIQFSITSSPSHHSSLRNVLTQDSTLRSLPIHDTRNASTQLVPLRNEKKSDIAPLMKSIVDGRMYSNYSKNGRNLWSGVIKNKENILSSADLICYSSDILPITIGGHIDIKAKVSFEKLKPLFPSPVFKQLPAFSTKCKAFDQSTMYLYCEIRPREKNNAKLAKLIKFFQQKNLAGVAEYADSSANIYVIPTSDFSHHLGLTDRYYPNMLHALILKRLPKEDIQSYKKMNKISADPTAEAAVRRDIRKELKRIEIEKLKQREQSDGSCRASSDMEVSSSEDRVVSEAKRKKTDVKSAETAAKVKVAKETSVAVVDVRHKDDESISKNTKDSIDTMQNEAQVPNKACQDVLSPATEKVNRTTTSNDNDKRLADPGIILKNKIADSVEVLKSPPPIRKHATVVDDILVDNEPHTNTVTRHFMDPRLGFKGDEFLPASPAEIEPLSSDSGADMLQPSPVLRHSKASEMSSEVILQTNSVLDDLPECTDSTGSPKDKIPNDKDNVSRLSSRLMALFSQTGKRLPKNNASIVTTISSITSSTTSATSTISSVTVLPSLPVESGNMTTTATATTITGHKAETATPPLNILSFTSSAPSVSSECNVSVAEDNAKVIDLPNPTTCAPLTPSQTSSFSGNRIYPNENTASSNSWIDSSETSSGVGPLFTQQAASFTICTSASVVSSSIVNSTLATRSFTENETSEQHLYSSERLSYPATTTLRSDANNSECKQPIVVSKQSDNLQKSQQSSVIASNTNTKETISFLRVKTTSLSGTSKVSPPLLSSPASKINVSGKEANKEARQVAHSCKPKVKSRASPSDGSSRYDQTSREYFSEGNHPQHIQTDNIAPCGGTMDWYDTVDTRPDEDVPKLSSSLQTPVTETSYETNSSVTVSIQSVGNSPPLPTEALPPPPPPPLTSSFSAGYTTCTYSNRNKDSLCYPTTTKRGLYTHSISYPEDHSNRSQPTFQESSDLYEYSLTLSSQHPTFAQDGSDLNFSKESTPSADSSRSSTPVFTLQEKQVSPGLFPQFLPTPIPPPPPPPPPLLHVYNPAGFHQDNYSTTYSTLYAHPYPVMQPMPIVNPTLSVSGNARYTNFPSPLNDFDSSAGFGYTKQITPLWSETPTIISDEGQFSEPRHVDQHVASGISSRRVDDIKSSTKRGHETANSLKTNDEISGTSKFPKKKSDHLQVQENTISCTFESPVDRDVTAFITTANASLTPVNEDIFCSETELAKQGEFTNSGKVPEKKYGNEGSCTEQHIQLDDEISTAHRTVEVNQGRIREAGAKKTGKQTQLSFSGNYHTIEKDKVEANIPSKECNVNLEEDKSFSQTNSVDYKQGTDQLQEKNLNTTTGDDCVNRSSISNMHVSNVSEFLDSNNETYEEIPVSDGEIPCGKSDKKSELTKTKKEKIQKTESKSNDDSSDCQSICTMSEYVDSNDETFVEIPLSEKAIGSSQGFSEGEINEDDEWQINTDPSKEIFTGRKRERITDLRELIKEKKQKLTTEDFEKRFGNRRRVVEIVRRETVVPGDSTPKPIELPDEMLRNVTSPDAESDDVIPDRIKIVLENRRKMTTPDSESCYSTPDGTQTLDEMKRNISSPYWDKKRRSTSPEIECCSSSPDWNSSEHRRRYNRRRAGSSDGSRTGSSTGSRPGSSASSRAAVSRRRSRLSLRTGSHSQAENSAKRYPPLKRARMQKEIFDKTREIAREQTLSQSDHVLGKDYPTSDRGLHDDYPGDVRTGRLDDEYSRNVLAGRLDDEYSSKSPVDSRRERQRSMSPGEKHYSYVSERDDSAPPLRLSPARESRYRSRYSIKRYNTRSNSSESDSRRARHSDKNNNSRSRHNDRFDQLDLSEDFLSRLIRPDVIERMQGYVYDDLQRTLVKNSDCLDEPDDKKQKPFFGGIGEYIYAKRDEEEARYEKERNYRSDLQTSKRAGRPRTGTSGDHHGEGTAADLKSNINSQSLGFNAEQNVVQKDVKIFNNINVKQFDVSAVCENEEHEDVRTAESTQNNQTNSELLSNPAFVAKIKKKRRRVLLDQLRNLRDKEKIGSCAILLAQLEQLKRDVRKLSAAKLKGNHQASKNSGQKESASHNNSKNNEVQKTKDTNDQLHNTIGLANVNVEGQEIIDTLDLGKCGTIIQENTAHALSHPGLPETVGTSAGYNVMSVETNSSNKAALNNKTEKRDEVLDKQLSTVGRMEMHKDTSNVRDQDSMKQADFDVAHYDNPKLDQQSLPTNKLILDLSHTDDTRNFIGKIDRRKEHKPDDIVDKPSPLTSAKDSPGIHVLKPSNIMLPKDLTTEGKRGETRGQHSKDTKEQENENSLLRHGNKEREYTGVKNRAGTKSIKMNVQDVSIPKRGSCRPGRTDERAAGQNYTDFDLIAHRAKQEFKFKLLIKSQELFPKQISGSPIYPKNQKNSTATPNTQKNENHTFASAKLGIEPKSKTSRHDLPVNQPSQNDCRQLEEDNLERHLSHVLNTLTKSQLHILRNGSPMARLRGPLRS